MSSSKYAQQQLGKNRRHITENTSDNMLLSDSQKTPTDKLIEHMNSYLRHVFVALSMSQSSLDGLVVIYELLAHKVTSTTASCSDVAAKKRKANDHVIQMLIATLWDGIVHMSLYVRCNTAKLFEVCPHF